MLDYYDVCAPERRHYGRTTDRLAVWLEEMVWDALFEAATYDLMTATPSTLTRYLARLEAHEAMESLEAFVDEDDFDDTRERLIDEAWRAVLAAPLVGDEEAATLRSKRMPTREETAKVCRWDLEVRS